MATSVTPPRGMRDFLPADKSRRERILGVIRATYRAHGFDEIETPVMEDSDRLHAGLGGDNEKLAFAVMKRALTVDDLNSAAEPLDLADLGLRFDLTVPLARFYASHRAELPTPFRALQIAPVWRAERPQKGRYRQFMQCDIDIIGEPTAIAEIELITATTATLDALGLAGCSIRINDRRLLASVLDVLGFPRKEHEPVLISVDKLDKLGKDGVIAELRGRGFPDAPVDALQALLNRGRDDSDGSDGGNPTAGSDPRPGGESPDARFSVAAILSRLPDGVDAAVVAELVDIARAVQAARVGMGHAPIEFDPWLVRGMGYYTGTIFEIAHPDFGYSIGGGGRYDGMVGRFLGSDVPAVGFSLGFERLVDLIELPPADEVDAAALIYEPGTPPATLVSLQTALIAQGHRVTLVSRPRNMRPLLEALQSQGYQKYSFVTPETADVVGTNGAESAVAGLEFRTIGHSAE